MGKTIRLAAAMAMALTGTPVAAQSVKAGIEAWQRSDYKAAVAIWRPLAEKGDADAAFNLGQAYRLGRGAPINLAAAQTWFERAARKGHVDAQATLGLLLIDSGSRADGLRWLKSAAEHGEPRALLIYGTALFNGDGVPKDSVLAYAYISRAAAKGLAPAKSTLAQMDQILSVEQRQKGVAIALAKAKAAPAPAPAPEVKAAHKPTQATTAQATAAPASKTSATAPVKAVAAPAVPASGAWRVQLGAFSQRSSAETLFKRLSGSGALAGRSAFYVPAGAVTRLQAGPFATRAAAVSVCATLTAKGQACFAVPAK